MNKSKIAGALSALALTGGLVLAQPPEPAFAQSAGITAITADIDATDTLVNTKVVPLASAIIGFGLIALFVKRVGYA